jgi:hypothetical protein
MEVIRNPRGEMMDAASENGPDANNGEKQRQGSEEEGLR